MTQPPLKTPPSHSAEPLWRDEFSVYAEDERLVTRRQFAKFLTLTSIGMAAGNLWILAKSWMRRTPDYPTRVIATAGEIPVQGVKLFTYPTPADPCLMIRTGEDVYVAYSQVCTHLSCAVFFSASTRRLECPCHKGSFSVADGSVIARAAAATSAARATRTPPRPDRRDRHAGVVMAHEPNRPALVVIDGALALIAVLLIVQMWLLSATLNAYLAGRQGVVLPAALVSLVLCAACLVLANLVRRMERK